MKIKQYTQDWLDRKRIILVSDKGSVFVDVDYSPRRFRGEGFHLGLVCQDRVQAQGCGRTTARPCRGSGKVARADHCRA